MVKLCGLWSHSATPAPPLIQIQDPCHAHTFHVSPPECDFHRPSCFCLVRQAWESSILSGIGFLPNVSKGKWWLDFVSLFWFGHSGPFPVRIGSVSPFRWNCAGTRIVQIILRRWDRKYSSRFVFIMWGFKLADSIRICWQSPSRRKASSGRGRVQCVRVPFSPEKLLQTQPESAHSWLFLWKIPERDVVYCCSVW